MATTNAAKTRLKDERNAQLGRACPLGATVPTPSSGWSGAPARGVRRREGGLKAQIATPIG